ncbi:MAG TPA: glycosyltransferase [Gaiellaceae bacterium]|nr:glycosyltransferase [Gaiellaceae bacterium]
MPPQILWRGPLFGVSEYAQEAREFALGLDRLGAHVRAEDLPLGLHRAPLEAAVERRLHALTTAQLGGWTTRVEHGPASRWSPGADAGRTLFDTDRIPEAWVAMCNAVNQVWVPSRFNLETFAASGVDEERLHVVPSPIRLARWRGDDRMELPTSGFTFLSVFDWSLRKGWDLLLAAYAEEFGPSDDVTLVLKIHSSHGHRPAELRRLIERAAGREAPPILVLDRLLATAEMPRLYRAAGCFVLSTRGEGCGRPFLEAMAAGTPVIGTAWGAQAELLTEETGYPIEVKGLLRVPEAGVAEAPLSRGHRWAEPSVEHLRELMRRVYERSDEARARAARARVAVEAHDASSVCSRLFLRLLEPALS